MRPARFVVRVLAAGFAALRAFPSKATLSSAHLPAPVGCSFARFDYPSVARRQMRAGRVTRLGMRTYRSHARMRPIRFVARALARRFAIAFGDQSSELRSSAHALQRPVHKLQIAGKSRGSTTNRIGRALRMPKASADPPSQTLAHYQFLN